MKIGALVLGMSLAAVPAAHAQLKAVDILGSFNADGVTARATEVTTGCHYVIDVGQTALVFHPYPGQQPATCKVLLMPDDPTEIDLEEIAPLGWRYALPALNDACVPVGGGLFTQSDIMSVTESSFRLSGSEDFNPANLASCRKVSHR